MRLFVAAGLPEALAARLAGAARQALPGSPQRETARWTRPEDMHITLSFLGSVEPSRLIGIEEALAAIRVSPLRVEFDGMGVFANAGVLFARVKPAPPLLDLAEQVARAMERCGFAREERAYRPHVTLARMKGRVRQPPGENSARDFQQSFAVREFRLYESFTRPEGASYRVLRSFPLV